MLTKGDSQFCELCDTSQKLCKYVGRGDDARLVRGRRVGAAVSRRPLVAGGVPPGVLRVHAEPLHGAARRARGRPRAGAGGFLATATQKALAKRR